MEWLNRRKNDLTSRSRKRAYTIEKETNEKDKLARYNPDNEILQNAILDEDVFILDECGHFPYFEDPDQLEKTFKKILD